MNSNAAPVRLSRRLLRVATIAAALAAVSAGLATGTPSRQAQSGLPLDAFAAACETGNPFMVMSCGTQIMVFQDTPLDRPHYALLPTSGAPGSGVGALWGLAYSAREQAIYAAASHRRGQAFGPGGPGAIVRIDLATAGVTQPITVPNAGRDRHQPSARGSDASATNFAGKTSLGDIDLNDVETELFAVNLEDRRIYRFEVPSGRLIGSFPSGGADEPWAEDARPWGLAVRAGVVYHGVVNSAESNIGWRRDIGGRVYASKPDGSDMRLVYAFPLDGDRPRIQTTSGGSRTDWLHWRAVGANIAQVVRPMPILSDLAFDNAGGLVIGLKDRFGDMGGGPALGDLLYAPPAGEGWGDVAPEHFEKRFDLRRSWPQGGIAAISVSDTIGTSATTYRQGGIRTIVWQQEHLWYQGGAAEATADERGCVVTPGQPLARRPGRALAAPLARPVADNGEEVLFLALAPGDVELLCAPTVYPTLTPSPTPLISPTPSATRTPSPTRTSTTAPTATPSPTTTPSPTRVPGPVYLPIAVSEPPCLPVRPILDVILILDASTSMADLTRAGRPKIDAAVDAARDFVARLALAPDGDHAALVAFNVAATLEAPLTADRAVLDAALDSIALAQFTRIDLGLDAAVAELASTRRRAGATAAVVLLTDGRSNPVPVSEAERAAEAVKATGARLFTIGLGQDLDADVLLRMASRPADYFEAPDGEDLAAIYQAISAALPCPPYPHWPARTAGGAGDPPSDASRLRAGSRLRAIEALRPSGSTSSHGDRGPTGAAR